MICQRTPRPLEVADILGAYGQEYTARHPVSTEQEAVIRHITSCRTAVLGGHVDACGSCGYQHVSYNSCRDRHCPKCQATKRAQWLKTRLERLLPVPYFHVVFTLPEQLYPLALRNKRLIYALLFKAASNTLLALAADPKRLGAQIGFSAVLHTWGQNLLFHPHLHCVVTGGGLSADGQSWLQTRQNYLFTVQVLSRLFRGKFLAGLQGAFDANQLILKGSTVRLAHSQEFTHLRQQLYQKEWVVYAKAPFAGPEHVYRYLGRYTHRVAISNSRLIKLKAGRVHFRYKDYADGCRQKVMELDAQEFVRRFLLHVLPKRFVRIRHYGLLAGRNVSTRLAVSRQLLASQDYCTDQAAQDTAIWQSLLDRWLEGPSLTCPRCGEQMIRLSWAMEPTYARPSATRLSTGYPVAILDSS